MPQRDVRAYLLDIRDAINEIELSVVGLDFDTYQSVRQIRSAVEREFMIIGEALRQIGEVDENLLESITGAAQIIAFRNRLAHGCFIISDATVWDIIHGHLPALRAEVRALLEE